MRKLSILAALVPLALVSSALASVPAANADDPLPVPVNGRPAVDASAFPTANLKIADDAAIPAAQSLFAYLKGLGSAGYTLFGHEGDTSSAVVNNEAAAAPGTWDGVVSDTRRATGALPGIVGFNVGYPGWGDPAAPIRAAYEQGVVIELSDHVGNFAADDIWGRWGYGVSTTPINPVEQVLPGAAKHFELTAYLDRVAQFADLLRDSDGELIPVIYRPWHEHNGDWFWWDTSNATEGELAELFRFTVHYLRDIKGVHNFLYAFSPNGHFENQAEYLYAYPGDDYIDILGVDTYDDVPVANPDWFAQALKDLQIVVTYANQTGKIAAMTETGVRYDAGGHGWRLTDPDYPTDWFTAMADMIRNDPIAKQISYWLLWANFDTGQFWVPFKDHAAYGNHHMLPDFIRMYNKDSMVFADRTGDFASLVPDGQDKAVKKGPAIAIHTPEFKDYVSGTRTVYVEANPRLTPCVHAFAGACADSPARTASPAEVSVTLGGVTVAAAPGDNNLWTAEIDTTEVPDGRVALSARAVYSATTFSHVYAARAEDSHDVFIQNTAPAPNADPYLIDDFESYDSTDDNRTDVERVWWRTSDVMNALRLRNSDDTYPADHWLSQAWSTGLDTGAVLRIKYDVVPKNGAHPETAVTKTYPAAARPDWSQANSFSAIVQPDGKGHFLKFRITVGAGNENAYECNVNAEPGSGYNPALVAPQRVAVPIGCFESLADGAPVAGAALGAVQTVEIRIEQDPAVGRMAGLNALEYFLLDELKVSRAPAASAAALAALIAVLPAYELFEAEQLATGRYTAESYAPFAAALAAGRALVTAGAATELAVRGVVDDLRDTAGALVPAVDASILRALIAAAQDIVDHPSGWVSANLPALGTALAAARDFLAAGGFTQAQVDAQSLALQGALAAVSPKGDKTGLNAAVSVAQGLDPERFTPASWAPVAAALAAAAVVAADPEAGVDQVDAAYAQLASALTTLVLRAAKAGLKSTIDVAATIMDNAASYQPASLAGLPEALASARSAHDDANATTAQVTQAQTALIAKIAAVRLKSGSPISGPLLSAGAAAAIAQDPGAAEAAVEAAGLVAGAPAGAAAPGQAALARFAKAPKPRIAGVRAVGSKLRAIVGKWRPEPTLRYQWYRGGAKIAKATKAVYKLKAADRGQRISVKVSAAKAGYAGAAKASAKTKRVE